MRTLAPAETTKIALYDHEKVQYVSISVCYELVTAKTTNRGEEQSQLG